MRARTFFLGLVAVFAFPWLVMVAVPYGQLASLQPRNLDEAGKEVYPPPSRGFVKDGQRVYMTEGCVQCHTQMIRPDYAGPDRWRVGWAGKPKQVRETQPLDYYGQTWAPLGSVRIGPDLANAAARIKDAKWHMQHLYDPRSVMAWSIMPSYAHLFEKRRIEGQASDEALVVEDLEEGWEIVPSNDAKLLVTYLLSLRKDAPAAPPEDATTP